ncbi:MAG: DUF3427 domain-containing protein [Polyangiaceae bacterium]
MDERERRLRAHARRPGDRERASKGTSFADACALLWRHPQILAELAELFDLLRDRIDHLHHALPPRHPHVPLAVHARYTRIEILAALGIGDSARVMRWQTGVLWAEAERADLLTVTLDKTGGQFSPTTRYRDYAISRDLFHWESQSATRADSVTGLRYQRHERSGSSIFLFVRPQQDDRAFLFLGPATYVSHQSERPMAITFRLHHPLPGDSFATFAAAVA